MQREKMEELNKKIEILEKSKVKKTEEQEKKMAQKREDEENRKAGHQEFMKGIES